MRLALIAVLCFLPGCITPSDKQIAEADFGSPPPADYRAHLGDYIRQWLKDPYSADIKIGDPYHAAQSSGLGWDFGWGVDAYVNARNAFGGYVGYRNWAFFYREGEGWERAHGGFRRLDE